MTTNNKNKNLMISGNAIIEEHSEIVKRLLELHNLLEHTNAEDDRSYWITNRELAWYNYKLACLDAKINGVIEDMKESVCLE